MKTVLVLEAEVKQNKKQEDYVVFSCRDIDGKEWTGCKIWQCSNAPEGVVDIEGKVKKYRGEDQLTAEKVTPSDVDPMLFLPKCPWGLNRKNLEKRWGRVVTGLQQYFRKFLQDFFTHIALERVFPDQDLDFQQHPGAIAVHHAYVSGLYEHTVEVMEISKNIAKSMGLEKHEEDLAIVGAAIHDIGKLVEIDIDGAVYKQSKSCRYTGWNSNSHLHSGLLMFQDWGNEVVLTEEEPLLTPDEFNVLRNIILSHHGEWGSTVMATIPARVVHMADMASAKINAIRLDLFKTEDDMIDHKYSEHRRCMKVGIREAPEEDSSKAKKGEEPDGSQEC